MSGEWIPVTERLPEPDVDVLVFMPKQSDIQGGVYIARLSSMEFLKGTFSTHFGFGFEVTHWTPLPAPPTDAK
jgi:hypothetical protein